MIIQIIGLPGSGKTTLADALSEWLGALWLNADQVRNFVNYDLGFSHEDRIEHSKRLGGMARLFREQGYTVIVDFVCPTAETRKAFGDPDLLVWVDRIETGRYEDTNLMWQKPENADIIIPYGMTVEEEVDLVRKSIDV